MKGKSLIAVFMGLFLAAIFVVFFHYNLQARLSMLAVGGLLLVAVIAEFWSLGQSPGYFRRVGETRLNEAINTDPTPVSDAEIFWLTNLAAHKLRWLLPVFTTLTGLAALSVITTLLLRTDTSRELIWLMAAMLAFLAGIEAIFCWVMHRASQLKLGVIGNSLVLQQNARKRIIITADGLNYTPTHLLTEHVVVALGTQQQRFFDREQLNRYIFPRLKTARQLRSREAITRLWRGRDPQLLACLLLTGLLLLGYAAAIPYTAIFTIQ